MNFSSIPPVVTIAPANKTEANAAPTAEGLEPGNAVVKLMGIAAQIGEAQEVWWALPGDAFTVDVGGNIYPDLRKAFFRLDTPGARLINRGGAYSCDWTDAHDLLRQKRWLRVDPILRDLGVCPDGLLSASQWKHPAEHAKVAEALCSPEALAAIAQLNGAEWSESATVAMPYKLANVLAPALEKILRQSEKHRAQSNLEKNAARWQAALRGANAILQGDSVEPAPVEDTNPEPEAVAAPVESSETSKHPRGRKSAAHQEG